MSVTITLGAVTFTTAAFTLGGLTGSYPEMQISTRKEFDWCVAPIFALPASPSAGVGGLNQSASYYVRARNVAVDGSRDTWGPTIAFRTPEMVPQNLVPPAIMVAPAMIVRPEPILTVTGGNEASGFPALNLLESDPIAWESVAAGGTHTITFSTAGSPMDVIALLQSNIPEVMTAKVRADNDPTKIVSDAAGPAFIQSFATVRASPDVPSRPGYHGLLPLAATVGYRHWRVELTGTVPGNRLHIEHLVAGLNRRTRNHSVDKKETPINLGSNDRLRSGIRDNQVGFKMRRLEFDLSMMTEAEFEPNYSQLWREVGETMFIVPNSRTGAFLHDRIGYGDFGAGGPVQNSANRYTRTFSIDSLI